MYSFLLTPLVGATHSTNQQKPQDTCPGYTHYLNTDVAISDKDGAANTKALVDVVTSGKGPIGDKVPGDTEGSFTLTKPATGVQPVPRN